MCGSGGCELAPRGHSKVGASPPHHCCHGTVTATTALPHVPQELRRPSHEPLALESTLEHA
eukprot:1954288-Pleurochrysis_carterae.AAC.1